jgi:hypothetical protein
MVQDANQDTGLQVELLESSFEKVKPQANEFVSSFYDNLFTDYPAAKPLFSHTNMAKQEICCWSLSYLWWKICVARGPNKGPKRLGGKAM